MKLSNIPKSHPLRQQKLRAISCGLALMLITPAHAQSAANFNVPAPAVAPPAVDQNSANQPATSEPAEAMDITTLEPSRRIGEERMPTYLQALNAVLTISKRETDPFGQVQDPDARPVIKTPIARTQRAAPMQATPFADIIRLIKVTTVMPSERKFLIGTRSIKQGDRIPLTFRGRNIAGEVASVSSKSSDFRNVENGETASLSLNLMPAGMTPGSEVITAPGMTLDRPDAPLDLDISSL